METICTLVVISRWSCELRWPYNRGKKRRITTNGEYCYLPINVQLPIKIRYSWFWRDGNNYTAMIQPISTLKFEQVLRSRTYNWHVQLCQCDAYVVRKYYWKVHILSGNKNVIITPWTRALVTRERVIWESSQFIYTGTSDADFANADM